ncbi:MAG: sulfatase/phosphatase domain-containing protein, partial [Bryobacteraceae bacterium]
GIYGHGQTVLQAQVHVPLIVKLPGSKTRRDSHELVSHVDLMPTILQVAGGHATNMDGSSLLPDARVRAGRHVLTESFPNTMRAVFRGDLKLFVSKNGERELYRPWHDPGEQRNLYVPGHPSARELEARLNGYLKRVPRRLPAGKLDDETSDALRSLGYIQ